MASFGAKALIFLPLSVLLLSSFTVLADEVDFLNSASSPLISPVHSPAPAPKPHKGGHHHNHKHAPAPAPIAKPPTYSPPKKAPPAVAKPPTHSPPKKAPSPSPTYPVHRKLFAVQGVVYCKSCKYPGIDTLTAATPLLGAIVKLQCNNTKYRPVEAKATTDKNGYFLLMAPKNVTTAAYHKCKMFLVSSPAKTCDVPTNLHAGSVGAILMPAASPPKPSLPVLPYQIFSVGPFAFQPSKKIPCPK